MSGAITSPDASIDTPSPDLTDFRDEEHPDARENGTWETLDYPDPIDHGHGIELVVNDLEDGDRDDFAYRRLWDAWRSFVADPSDEPFVLQEDVHKRWDWLHDEYPAHLVLKSKGWKAGTDSNGDEITSGQRYEYSLQVMRYDPESGDLADEMDQSLRAPVSYQAWIQPQNEELVLPSGDNLTCHYGEGTKIRTQTTYTGSQGALVRTIQVTNAAFEALDRERPDWSAINRESWRVWKGEVHHRIAEELMDVVANKLRSARTLVEYGGDGNASGGGSYSNGQHVEERVVSDMWDRIGFAGYAARDGYNLGVKVYRLGGSPADDRLRHPKLEAFFAGTDDETKLPHVDEWEALRATLRQMVSTFAIRSGVALAELMEDDYYHPTDREMVDVIVPDGWRRAMEEANEERERRILKISYESLSKARWDVLWTVAVTKGANYDTLVEYTGYSRDYIREIVRELKEEDVLRRRTYPRVVVYHNEELRLNALEALREVYPDRGLQEIREDAEERRRDRAESDDEDDVQEEDDVDDGAGEADDDGDSGSDWIRVDELAYSREDIGRYLEDGAIAADEAKVRVDRNDWLRL